MIHDYMIYMCGITWFLIWKNKKILNTAVKNHKIYSKIVKIESSKIFLGTAQQQQ